MISEISIQNFTKSFGSLLALNDLSFDVHRGETFAFLGRNGSGKTTTMRCLLDIYPPDKGKLLIKGQKYSYKMNKFIGYLPEERGIYTDIRVMDILIFCATLRGVSNDKAKKDSLEFIEKVGLKGNEYKKISQLSSGMQQKVQLITAMIHKPEILIMDEPFKGLDPVNRQLFIDIFNENKESGTTILYSTHVIDEAQKLADRLVIIDKGKRIEYGTIDEVRKKYGKDSIHIEFSGTFPKNEKLYKFKITNRTAEVVPIKGIDTQQVIKYITSQEISIFNLTIDYPSLNEVFIRLTKEND